MLLNGQWNKKNNLLPSINKIINIRICPNSQPRCKDKLPAIALLCKNDVYLCKENNMVKPLKISGGLVVTDGKIYYFFDRKSVVISYCNHYGFNPYASGLSDCKYIPPSTIAIIFEKGKRPDLPYPQSR